MNHAQYHICVFIMPGGKFHPQKPVKKGNTLRLAAQDLIAWWLRHDDSCTQWKSASFEGASEVSK